MRGTQTVGSLLRLLLCAAFLCVAWIMLSSARADAAERPAPVEVIASPARPVTASVLSPVDMPESTPTRVPATAPAVRDSVAAVSRPSVAVVVPVVDRLGATTAATVSAGADELKAVAAAVPVLEGPEVVLADELAALVDAVPVVGREPLVDAPLPGLPAAPLPAKLPELDLPERADAMSGPANLIAKQGSTASSPAPSVVPRGLSLAALDPVEPWTGTRTVAINARAPLRSVTPEAPHTPAPWLPPEPAPKPPTQSAPNTGGGAPSGDLASMGQDIVVSNPTTGGPRSSDWWVPGGLPAQPGTRPD